LISAEVPVKLTATSFATSASISLKAASCAGLVRALNSVYRVIRMVDTVGLGGEAPAVDRRQPLLVVQT